MRVTQVRGIPVLDTVAARQAGLVAGVAIDLDTARVVAVDVKHGDGLLVDRIAMEHVERIGLRAVLAPRSHQLVLVPSRDWPESVFGTDALLGLQALSEDGDSVGRVSDAHFDPKTLTVHAYEITTSAWEPWRRRTRILPDDVLACSHDAMLVSRRPDGPEVGPVERLQHALGLNRKA
jgi:uncharacterized protein YrrD